MKERRKKEVANRQLLIIAISVVASISCLGSCLLSLIFLGAGLFKKAEPTTETKANEVTKGETEIKEVIKAMEEYLEAKKSGKDKEQRMEALARLAEADQKFEALGLTETEKKALDNRRGGFYKTRKEELTQQIENANN